MNSSCTTVAGGNNFQVDPKDIAAGLSFQAGGFVGSDPFYRAASAVPDARAKAALVAMGVTIDSAANVLAGEAYKGNLSNTASVGCVISRTINPDTIPLCHARLHTAQNLGGHDLFHCSACKPVERSSCARGRASSPRGAGNQRHPSLRNRSLGRAAGSFALYLAASRRGFRFPDSVAVDQIALFAAAGKRSSPRESQTSLRARDLAAAVLGTASEMPRRLQRASAILLAEPGETRACRAPRGLALFKLTSRPTICQWHERCVKSRTLRILGEVTKTAVFGSARQATERQGFSGARNPAQNPAGFGTVLTGSATRVTGKRSSA